MPARLIPAFFDKPAVSIVASVGTIVVERASQAAETTAPLLGWATSLFAALTGLMIFLFWVRKNGIQLLEDYRNWRTKKPLRNLNDDK